MNDSPEEEEDDATTDILIGEGDDWPEDYSDGFDAPMKIISEIASNRSKVPVTPIAYLTPLMVARWIMKVGVATRPEGVGAGSLCSSDRRSTNKRSRRF